MVIALGKGAYDLEGGGDSLPHLFSVTRANLLTSGSLQPGLTSLSGQPLTLLGPTFSMPSPGPTASLCLSICQAWLTLLPAL